jgi:hypothetical protein
LGMLDNVLAVAQKRREFTKRRMPRQLAMYLVLLALLISASTACADDWQSLFDGRTLDGWHSPGNNQAGSTKSVDGHLPQRGSHPQPCTTSEAKTTAWEKGAAHWEVAGGVIRACDAGPGYLTSGRSFKNFVLSLEFKAPWDTNSGVFIRNGYEVQIWTDQAAGYTTGAIVGVAKTAKHYDFKADRWNILVISAEGDHMMVLLNGKKTLDTKDSKFTSGPIRLQYWDYPISYRNLKIRELP